MLSLFFGGWRSPPLLRLLLPAPARGAVALALAGGGLESGGRKRKRKRRERETEACVSSLCVSNAALVSRAPQREDGASPGAVCVGWLAAVAFA
jgi:hypothetical protein